MNRKQLVKITLFSALTAVLCLGPVIADDKAAAMAKGKEKFGVCMACHGLDGKGMQAGPQKMAPGYAESEAVKAKNAEVMALIIMKGIKKVDNKYLQMMLPLEAAMKDEDLAGVITYIRNTFGGHDDFITSDQVKGWREKYKDRKDAVTREEIAEKLKE